MPLAFMALPDPGATGVVGPAGTLLNHYHITMLYFICLLSACIFLSIKYHRFNSIFTGASGTHGANGTGVNGAPGANGVPGTNGLNRATGATGAAGPAGAPENTGLTGPSGAPGMLFQHQSVHICVLQDRTHRSTATTCMSYDVPQLSIQFKYFDNFDSIDVMQTIKQIS